MKPQLKTTNYYKSKLFVFRTDSWHYHLVMYVFGNSFFFEKHFDHNKVVKKLDKVEEKSRKENPDDHNLEKAHDQFFSNIFDNDDYYTFTPKRINFCPYCRAVVMSSILFPFAILKNLIPQRKKKPFDIKKSERNTKILKIAVMAIIGSFGVHQTILGNYGLALFHFSVASFQIWGKYLFEWYANWYKNRLKKKQKEEEPKSEIKNPSLFLAYLKSNHSKVCPPVTFVDNNDTAVRV